MKEPSTSLRIAFFGSSLVSSYWNGAATYYRGLLRALASRGHQVTFYEPDAFDRQQHRDIPDPPWATVVVYPPTTDAALAAVADASRAHLLVKASGVGVLDDVLDSAVAAARRPGSLVAYWDVDAPATLDKLRAEPRSPLARLVPRWDIVFTYGGGDPVVRAYRAFGARACVPIYNAVDPETHDPVRPEARFAADLSLMANRLPDREDRVHRFFFAAARALPRRTFLLGGSGWQDDCLPRNVRSFGHVPTADHNAWNTSALAVLNVSRDSMARTGYSPATRVFEAAGAGACLITDAWEGVEQFLEPGREILVAESGEEVASIVASLATARARAIGEAARRRVLAEHTYARRAVEVEAALAAARAAAGMAP
jgi:spore maturation protein CgeB